MDDETYRLEKLNFVSNLNGTSIDRIFNILILVPLVYFLSILIKIQLILKFYSLKKIYSIGFWSSFLLDYIFALVPLIFLCTIYEKWSEYFIYGIILTCVVIYLPISKAKKSLKSNNKLPEEIDTLIVKLTISSFRVLLYVFTTISILAVDFKIFPRYLAKTEKYGISIMDLGVGMYIAVHSMKIIRNDRLQQSDSFVSGLLKEFKASSILILIGCLRLLSVKSTNYVEHVSEY
ncbi:phosphatidylinositol-glycan biosynthesis class W -like, partial [Brachionus plicatilis]